MVNAKQGAGPSVGAVTGSSGLASRDFLFDQGVSERKRAKDSVSTIEQAFSLGARNDTTAPVVECRNVWKIFGAQPDRALRGVRDEGMTKAEVLDRYQCVVGVADVSFEVSRGEIFCVMGLSGSGKSTLLRHVNRLIEPTGGEIRVAGVDINRISSAELRRIRASTVAMVFQNMALFPHRTVIDNVGYGLEVQGTDRSRRHTRAMEVLDMVGLTQWARRYPDELSGGMKQRVGLARALAPDPQILLMDEPFSALDPLIRRQLQDEFLRLADVMRKTTIFITHDLDEAIRVGDRIAIMRDGMFAQVGTPEVVLTAPADDYVAAFVSETSPLKVVRARSVMRPLKSVDLDEATLAACVDVREDVLLDELLATVLATDGPVVLTDIDGRRVGYVDRQVLSSTLQRKRATSRPLTRVSLE